MEFGGDRGRRVGAGGKGQRTNTFQTPVWGRVEKTGCVLKAGESGHLQEGPYEAAAGVPLCSEDPRQLN